MWLRKPNWSCMGKRKQILHFQCWMNGSNIGLFGTRERRGGVRCTDEDAITIVM